MCAGPEPREQSARSGACTTIESMTASTSTSAADSSAAVLAAWYHENGLDSAEADAALAAEYAAADAELAAR